MPSALLFIACSLFALLHAKPLLELGHTDWDLTEPRPGPVKAKLEGKHVMVAFYANGCEPCQRMKPYLEMIAESWSGHPALEFSRIDVNPGTPRHKIKVLHKVCSVVFVPADLGNRNGHERTAADWFQIICCMTSPCSVHVLLCATRSSFLPCGCTGTVALAIFPQEREGTAACRRWHRRRGE